MNTTQRRAPQEPTEREWLEGLSWLAPHPADQVEHFADCDGEWPCSCVEAMAPVLGKCSHGVDLDREFCPDGCRV